MGMGADCTPSDYEGQGRGRRGCGSRWSEGWLGVGTAWIAGRPLAQPSVQILPGCVPFSAKCVHFSGQITPNVSTRTGNVSTLSLDGGLEPTGAKALVLALQGRLCDRWRGCPEDPSLEGEE